MKEKMNNKTRRLTVTATLAGLMIAMYLLKIHIWPIPPAGASVLAVPVVIGTLYGGLAVGLPLGGVFGLISFYNSFTNPVPFSVAYMNPVVSILPRLCIPIVVYFIAKLLKKQIEERKTLAIIICSIAGSLTNTILVLGTIGILYQETVMKALSVSSDLIWKGLLTIGLTNGLPEAAICALVCVPVFKAISHFSLKQKNGIRKK